MRNWPLICFWSVIFISFRNHCDLSMNLIVTIYSSIWHSFSLPCVVFLIGTQSQKLTTRPMDGYYVVGVTAIPYPGFGVLIIIVSKEDIAYCVTITDMPHGTCPDFTKISSQSLGKKMKWMYCKHLYYVFRFLCKADYGNDKFIHTPSFVFNRMFDNFSKWHVLV